MKTDFRFILQLEKDSQVSRLSIPTTRAEKCHECVKVSHSLKFEMRFPSIPFKAQAAMAVGGVVCSVVGGVVILKDSVGGGQYDKEAKQDDTPAGKKSYKETCKDKVYVVTG